jgi:hypothetical protein
MQDENLPVWLPQLAVHGRPSFLQIAHALQAAVVGGLLKPGDRLLPQRQLARVNMGVPFLVRLSLCFPFV